MCRSHRCNNNNNVIGYCLMKNNDFFIMQSYYMMPNTLGILPDMVTELWLILPFVTGNAFNNLEIGFDLHLLSIRTF